MADILLSRIYRYPVKGLAPEALDECMMTPGEGLDGDRVIAFAHQSAPFDRRDPKYLPKTHFLMLMRDEELAGITARFDAETRVLTLSRAAGGAVSGQIDDLADRDRLAQFVHDETRGKYPDAPRLEFAPGHMFSDRAEKLISIINPASVADLASRIGEAVDPLRFRGNCYLEGASPWAEFDWIGREFELGTARLAGVDRIQRCAATNVDPVSGVRDLNIPQSLADCYGHMDLGIYARVVSGGTAAAGDGLRIAE